MVDYEKPVVAVLPDGRKVAAEVIEVFPDGSAEVRILDFHYLREGESPTRCPPRDAWFFELDGIYSGAENHQVFLKIENGELQS